jgi:AraC-like DNA-binding protein
MAMMRALSDAYGPAIIAGRSFHRPDRSQRIPLPRRGGYTLLLVDDGRVRLEQSSKSMDFAPGSVAIFDTTIRGSLSGPPGAKWHRIHFDVVHRPRVKRGRAWVPVDPAEEQPPAEAVFNLELPLLFPTDLRRGLRRRARVIADRWWRSNLDLLGANAELGQLLAECVNGLRTRWSPEQSAPTINSRDVPDWLLEAEAFARTAITHGCSVADLAEQVGVSRANFAARYRDLRGEPPGAFLRRLRLDAGRAALDSGATVAAAAHAAGYRSVGAFSAAFSLANGLSPDRWRRRG